MLTIPQFRIYIYIYTAIAVEICGSINAHSSSSLIKHEMRSILWTVKTLCSTKRVYIIMNTYLHQVLASSMKFKKLNFIQFSCIENQ